MTKRNCTRWEGVGCFECAYSGKHLTSEMKNETKITDFNRNMSEDEREYYGEKFDDER